MCGSKLVSSLMASTSKNVAVGIWAASYSASASRFHCKPTSREEDIPNTKHTHARTHTHTHTQTNKQTNKKAQVKR